MAIFNMRKVKNADVAGSFYYLVPEKLIKSLTDATSIIKEDIKVDSALLHGAILPHAGYTYSLECSLKTLLPNIENKTYKKVVILSPTHKKFFHGIAYSNYTAFAIPTGELQVDITSIAKLKDSKNQHFILADELFDLEHAIEVQLPIISHLLGKVEIVPLIVGALSVDELTSCAQTLSSLDSEDTLWIVSSDFTHYGTNFNYTPWGTPITCEKINKQLTYAATLVANRKLPEFFNYLKESKDTICGIYPIALYLTILKLLNKDITGSISSITTSAAKTNNWSNLVGYCGIKFVYTNP